MTITGTDLDGATGVSFGGTPAASFSVVSPTQIVATTRVHAAGKLDVQVSGPGGVSPVSAADAYTFTQPLVAAPAVAIASPGNGTTYAQGQAVNAAYSCAAPAGVTVSSCAGPVPSGAPIDTTTLGSHIFTVTARDSDGATASRGALYAVVPGPGPGLDRDPGLDMGRGAPILSGASETATRWRENDSLPHISAKQKPPVGTTFSFALNQSATVTFTFTHQVTGRKLHHKCLAPGTKNRHKPRCNRPILAGRLIFAGHPGANQVRFAGRISRTNKLEPGRYTLRITATNSQRERSASRSVTFTIVK